VDNAGYGEIRNEMRERGDEPLGTELPSPDFPALGRALGCHGVRADTADEVEEALANAFAADRPTVVHVPEETAARRAPLTL
jgi:acetolactate synthase-1/2/3 large subunit